MVNYVEQTKPVSLVAENIKSLYKQQIIHVRIVNMIPFFKSSIMIMTFRK